MNTIDECPSVVFGADEQEQVREPRDGDAEVRGVPVPLPLLVQGRCRRGR